MPQAIMPLGLSAPMALLQIKAMAVAAGPRANQLGGSVLQSEQDGARVGLALHELLATSIESQMQVRATVCTMC